MQETIGSVMTNFNGFSLNTPFFPGISDQILFIYARKLVANNDAVITLVDDNNLQERIPEIKVDIAQMANAFPGHVIIENGTMEKLALKQYDLLLKLDCDPGLKAEAQKFKRRPYGS
jgi:hypothetical protein